MSNLPGNRQILYVERASNPLGTAAFVLSLVAFFSAGILSPLSLILSLCAMQNKPKDLAVAGLVLSLVTIPLSAVFWFFVLIPFLIAAGVLGASASQATPPPRAPARAPAAQVAPAEKAPSIRVISPTFAKQKNGKSYTVSMKIKNTSSKPVVRVALTVEMVDFNGEVVAKDVFNTALPNPLMMDETRLFEIDLPRYSPLNAEMPATCKPRVTVLDVKTQ